MDRKTDLTSSLLKLQALRDKVRLTEEAQIRQQNLRKEYEDQTEKLIAENDKISATLLEKQKTTKQYKDLTEKLYRQKAELEKKLRILLGRVQENQEEIQGEENLVVKPVEMVRHKATSPESETTLKHVAVKPVVMVGYKAASAEPETTLKYDEVEYDANEEIWELKKSIEEIESQLNALEQKKD